ATSGGGLCSSCPDFTVWGVMSQVYRYPNLLPENREWILHSQSTGTSLVPAREDQLNIPSNPTGSNASLKCSMIGRPRSGHVTAMTSKRALQSSKSCRFMYERASRV